MTDNKSTLDISELNIDFTGVDYRSLGWIKLKRILVEDINRILGSDSEAASMATITAKYIIEHAKNPDEINRALEFLSQINWEELVNEREIKRDKEICVRCEKLTPVRNCAYLFNGFWGEIGFHCDKCIQELERKYNYVCTFCNSLYLPIRKGHLARVCNTCYNNLTHKEQSLADKIGHYLLETEGDLTLKEWRETVNHFDGKCAYCLTKKYKHIEHFVPRILGGKTTITNCFPACKSCNSSKRDRDPRVDALNDFIGIEKIRKYIALHSTNQ